MEWKLQEFCNGVFGKYPAEKIRDFLNTLPIDRALEAKIMICNTVAYIFYRE